MKYAMYCLQLTSHFEKIERTHFEEGVFVETVSPGSFFNDADVGHWKEWLGTLAWEEMESSSEVIIAFKNSDVQGVLDQENNDLISKCYSVYRSLGATTWWCQSHIEIHVLSGDAEMVGGELRIKDIRQQFTQTPFLGSYWSNNFEGPAFDHNNVIDKWKRSYTLIDREVLSQRRRQFLEALRSIEKAFLERELEFKIPNLVRCVESLVVIYSAKEFKKVLAEFAGKPPVCDLKVHDEYEELLGHLYDLRSDCIHGKPFAYSLIQKTNPKDLETEVARYEYLAEWLAITVLQKSFALQDLDVFLNRDNLVTFWEKAKQGKAS